MAECEDCMAEIYLYDTCEWPDDTVLCWGCLWNRYEKLKEQCRTLTEALRTVEDEE
jgi:hypothetical protein